MLIASKFEEIYAPEIRDFVYICDKSYSRAEILEMEYEILSTLGFNILTVYPYTFLSRYHFVTGESKKAFMYSQYILESSLLEYRMLKYKPSIKAAASLYISRKLLKLEPHWGKDLQIASNYMEKELLQCAADMCNILDIIPKTSLRACFNKYSSETFLSVSKLL
jgi:cyclin B